MAFAGFAALEYGLWTWWEPAAWMVGGAVFLVPLGLRVVERVR